MKKLIIFFALAFFFSNVFAQMPFSTYVKPTTESVKAKVARKTGKSITADNDAQIQKLEEDNRSIRIANIAEEQFRIPNNNREIKRLQLENVKQVNAAVAQENRQLGKPDFLDHLNANIVAIQNANKMFPTINGEVINYKLSLWTSYSNKKDTIRHYLPICLITKVSGNYSDSAAGASDDATSIFGAPLTLRLSPSFELFKDKLRENRLFFGANTDLRLLTIGDTVKNKLQTTWGVYASAGFSYMGSGYAYEGEDVDAANRHDGTWSFSAILYLFKSGGDYNKAVFGNYEKKTLSGLELLLRFKTSKKEDAKFNFLIGASNCFTKSAPNTGWQFRLGIGS